jgi:hypothetical protein
MTRTLRWSAALGAVALAAGLTAIAGASVAAAAGPDTGSTSGGYVWASQPTTPSYDALTPWSWNSAGLVNHINRTGTGNYVVTFQGVAHKGGTAQVSTYGSTVADCGIVKFAPAGTDEQVAIHCFKPGGTTPVDAQFDAYYAKPKGTANYLAYALADQPSSAAYTPSAKFQYDNRGGTITVTRSGVGMYQVAIPNIASYPTSVQVTAYGAKLRRCAVLDWYPGTDGTQLVDVECVNPVDVPADSKFVVSMQNVMNLLGANAAAEAAVWADQPVATDPYTPDLDYQWNNSNFTGGLGPALTITRTGTGNYRVTIPALGQITDGGHAEVTVYGTTSGRCQVVDWGFGDNQSELVDVHCSSTSGSAADQYFTMQFTGQQ